MGSTAFGPCGNLEAAARYGMTSADQAQDDVAAQVAWLHLDWVVAGDGERVGLGTERHAVDSEIEGARAADRSEELGGCARPQLANAERLAGVVGERQVGALGDVAVVSDTVSPSPPSGRSPQAPGTPFLAVRNVSVRSTSLISRGRPQPSSGSRSRPGAASRSCRPD
jgi:hypothetical protein